MLVADSAWLWSPIVLLHLAFSWPLPTIRKPFTASWHIAFFGVYFSLSFHRAQFWIRGLRHLDRHISAGIRIFQQCGMFLYSRKAEFQVHWQKEQVTLEVTLETCCSSFGHVAPRLAPRALLNTFKLLQLIICSGTRFCSTVIPSMETLAPIRGIARLRSSIEACSLFPPEEAK